MSQAKRLITFSSRQRQSGYKKHEVLALELLAYAPEHVASCYPESNLRPTCEHSGDTQTFRRRLWDTPATFIRLRSAAWSAPCVIRD